MNRFQRKYSYKKPNNNLDAKRNRNEAEELWALQSRQMKSRCCYITPEQLNNSLAKHEPPRTGLAEVYYNTHTSPDDIQFDKSFELIKSSSFASGVDKITQNHNVIVTEPYRSTVTKPNPVPKSIKPNTPKVITIAEPNRPTLPDMSTIPKPPRRPYVHILADVNKRTQPFKANPRGVVARKSSSTLPDESVISEPFALSAHEMKTVAAAQVSSTLPDLKVDQGQERGGKCFLTGSKHEMASQYVKPKIARSNKEIRQDKSKKIFLKGRDEETLTQYHNQPKNLHISEIPRIKLMAVKSTKYKKENIELRRIEEKIVCVEYDVFDKELDEETPVQKMRAFFSINPIASNKEAVELTELPPTIKSQFKISTGGLQKLSQKEIEIIDGKIIENQPYLNDLRKLLRRKENATKNKNTLNLQALYDMAKKDMLDFDNNLDIKMTKEELAEMRNFILKNCKSSVDGLRRKTVKSSSKMFEQLVRNTISENLETEREFNKT